MNPVLFRGERDGHLRQCSLQYPLFFTERAAHALMYSGVMRGHQRYKPIAMVWNGAPDDKILDLTDLRPTNPDHAQLLKRLHDAFADDGWICRYSGEERDVYSYILGGDLYDYEASGNGERWRKLFEIALDEMNFCAVRIIDRTDGLSSTPSVVWVTHRNDLLRQASSGEEIAALLHPHDQDGRLPENTIRQWIETDYPDLITRINRLSCVDESYRLDRMHEVIPPKEMSTVRRKIHQTIWRALPTGCDIRPGDWVALDKRYAQKHQRHVDSDSIEKLDRVLASDIYWSGTDTNEFFYLPQAWVKPGAADWLEYLLSLTCDQIEVLCDGEMHRIRQHADAIRAIENAISETFDADACGTFHGPDHWSRVATHALATARAQGVQALVPYVFGKVHDSQREDEGLDPGHGPRAAQWIYKHASDLFGFLDQSEIDCLAQACDGHSDGFTSSSPVIEACWDADRLDLWRVDIEPDPDYLCHSYAKNPLVIADAQNSSSSSRPCYGDVWAHMVEDEDSAMPTETDR